jgi:PIN domain nuclease of toxin-antitoxin system
MRLPSELPTTAWVEKNGSPSNRLSHLSKKARQLIDAKANELFFSSANIWEVVIKRGLGREDFKVDARVLRRGLFDNGYSELPIASEHVVAIESLPLIHKDPFDRILIAQAQVEGITLVTADPKVAEYSGPITLV